MIKSNFKDSLNYFGGVLRLTNITVSNSLDDNIDKTLYNIIK